MRIGVDLMGGDLGPEIMIPAVKKFQKVNPGVTVVAYGDSAALADMVKSKSGLSGIISGLQQRELAKIETVETTHNIVDEKSEGGDINPMRLLSGDGQKSSIVQGVKAVGSNDIDGFLTRGNSGALALTSMRELGEKGKSGALSVWVPRKGAKDVFMLDVGAYPDAKLEHLLRNADLGVSYLQSQGLDEPKIGLLNVGIERYKGKSDYRNAHKPLSEKYGDSFLGNFEPGDVFNRTDADLIVVGGHEGNIWLKTAEATGSLYAGLIKESLFPGALQKITRLRTGVLLKRSLGHYHPDNRPDGTILGIDGKIVKVHGSAGVKPSAIGMQRMVSDITRQKDEA